MGGLQLGILIGFIILIFVCFSVVPFFLLKKNYRKVKLLNKDDNGYILLEGEAIKEYFTHAKLQHTTLYLQTAPFQGEKELDITIVTSKDRKRKAQHYKFKCKGNEVLSIEFDDEVYSLNILVNRVDNRVISSDNRYATKLSLILSSLIGTLIFAAGIIVVCVVESNCLQEYYDDYLGFYFFAAGALVFTILSFVLNVVFDRKVKIQSKGE